jgi:hypothetical protein
VVLLSYALDVGRVFARPDHPIRRTRLHGRFYALDVGLGFATLLGAEGRCQTLTVSMPSMSGWALRPRCVHRGRGNARARFVSMPSMSGWALRLQVPKGQGSVFHHSVSMPSMSGWALRRQTGLSGMLPKVSMPSMSGWALRRMRSDGTSDLGIWCPFRQPPPTGDHLAT